MKQTAVDWLHEQLTSTWFDGKSSKEVLEIAKQKEREQIEEAHREGVLLYAESGKNYYELTYGNK